MNLFDIFKNDFKEIPTNDGFLKELDREIKYGDEKSMIDSISKLITEYRDKMKIERNKILNEYAKETSEKGEMYFIFSKTDTYNLSMCGDEKSHEVIKVTENDLPEDAEIDCVLRKENDRYVLDKEATEIISMKTKQMIEDVLKEQERYLSEVRIEGHTYEIVEKSVDRVCLYDIDNDNGETIEEIDFPEDLMEQINEGDKVVFIDGKYKI